jgi:hypothetical protein
MANIFLYGEDSVAEVREIRDSAQRALLTGQPVSWTSGNTTVQKIRDIKLDRIINDANEFLRLYCPRVKAKNPIRDISRPVIWF